MRILSFIIIFSTIILLGSCNKEELSPNTIDTDIDVPVIIPKGDENYLTMDSDYVFDQNALHTFELKISESNLAFLDADPVAEEYVEGMLIFQGDTISPVGVRYKGSVGAFVGCLSGGNIFAPSGEKTCTKLSMKIQINWEGRDEKFFKQKKLQFHSMNLDPTQMHERLGYWLFRELGVPGPRSVHSRLLINDEYVGLFALTEQIDNRMIKYNFDDDDGNLYKEIWPLSMQGEPYSDQKYIDALKTNEDDNPSIDLIKNFGEEIKNASSTDINAIVEQYMNIDEIISYAVVDRTIRHDD
ncbi:MAG: CotH kinase family protein, partial [Saprospiraceae bacterium]